VSARQPIRRAGHRQPPSQAQTTCSVRSGRTRPKRALRNDTGARREPGLSTGARREPGFSTRARREPGLSRRTVTAAHTPGILRFMVHRVSRRETIVPIGGRALAGVLLACCALAGRALAIGAAAVPSSRPLPLQARADRHDQLRARLRRARLPDAYALAAAGPIREFLEQHVLGAFARTTTHSPSSSKKRPKHAHHKKRPHARKPRHKHFHRPHEHHRNRSR
jgi:hypothetical protein